MSEQPRVSQGRIYPIKSCKPLILDKGASYPLGPHGLLLDRAYMVVGKDHKARTQRKRHPGFQRLALVQPAISRDNKDLIIGAEMQKPRPVRISMEEEGEEIDVEIWGDKVRAVISREGSLWFSEFLDQDCLLVRKSGKRLINQPYAPDDAEVGFADRNQILVISRATLHAFNQILHREHNLIAEMNRFRPNLILEGCDDREENDFVRIKIGKAILHSAIPCERCEMPANNQTTAEFRKEILDVLRDHRKPHDNKPPLLGEQFFVEKHAHFTIGSPVEVLERHKGWSRKY